MIELEHVRVQHIQDYEGGGGGGMVRLLTLVGCKSVDPVCHPLRHDPRTSW
jgi:hypothetical protein